jgi:outer membrane protein, heavy metal efflux system
LTDTDADGAAAALTAAAELDSLVAAALRQAPGVAMRDADLAAMREEATAAGALPDPMIGFSATGEDYPGGGLGREPMSVAALEVSQTIPWPGKRGLRDAAAQARLPEFAARRDGERRRLAADVRAAWADLYATDAATAALREELALVDLLEPGARSRYETGAGSQDDWLALRRARARLASAVDAANADRAEVVARLGVALADTAAAARVNALVLPALPLPADAGRGGEAFADVAAARAATEAARREREAAAREGRPDLVLGAEYGWREALAPMFTARVGLEVPLWRGRKQDAMARAAGFREAGARALEDDARRQADAEARTLTARAAAAQATATRLRQEILPLLDLTAEGARARYLTGAAPAGPLLETLRERAEARAELARAEADAFAALTRLRALAGRDPVAGDGKDSR